jgi:hypothetical protein
MSETETITEVQDQLSPDAPRPKAREMGRDLVVMNQGNAVVPLPASFAQMVEMAQLMSRGANMVGKAFRSNPGACLGVLTQAMRWGMDPYAVSLKCYVADKSGEGPIAYEGQLVHAIIMKNAPLQKRLRCTYSGEGDARRITVIGWLKGEDEPFEYPSPELRKIKKNSPLWVDDPDQQLWYYGVRAWARKWCPDVIMGVYTPEELQGQPGLVGEAMKAGAGLSLVSDLERAEAGDVSDAEFTPIEAVLNRANSPKPHKQKDGADPKASAASAPGSSQQKGGDKSKGKAGKAKADSPAAKAAAPPKEKDGDDGQPGESGQPGTPATEAKEEPSTPETDADLVARVEQEHRDAKGAHKDRPIKKARADLERIAKGGGDLAKRADKLLNLYDLDEPNE